MLDPKWTGTDVDRREMRTLNLDQVVRVSAPVTLCNDGLSDCCPQRNFGKLAMFGFASTLLCTWESLTVGLSISLANGGTAGLFWNYVIGAIGFGFIYASIAELGSM